MTEPYDNLNELDERLEAALKEYSKASPRAGLEGRILANLRTAPAELGWLGWPRRAWVGAALAVCVLAISVWMGMRPRLVPDDSARKIEPAPVVKPNEAVLQGAQAAAKPKTEVTVRRPSVKVPLKVAPPMVLTEVKQAVFPTPAPLSDQERLALSYARIDRGREFAALKVPEPGIRELEIKPIDFPAIKVEELSWPETTTPALSRPGLSKPVR